MGYLLDQLVWWLLLAALSSGAAGWAFHKMRHAGAVEALDRQREQARRELVAHVNPPSGEEGGNGFIEHERESDLLRTRSEISEGRIAELQRGLEEARRARDDAQARIADLERSAGRADDNAAELEQLRTQVAEAEARRAAEVEVEATPAPDANALRWRMRYLESRTRYLEGLQAVPVAPPQMIAAPAPPPPPEPPPPAPAPVSDEANAQRWRARYFEGRVRYLESDAARSAPVLVASPLPPPSPPAPSPEELEADQRRHWRTRYLETRLGHLEDIAADAAKDWAARREALEAQVASLTPALAQRDARIAELEQLAPLAERARRLAWRARYLDARVRHLEQAPATPAPASPEPPAAPAPVDIEDAAPAPLVAPGQEVRPPALPAARDGAPDDFTLIEGVSALQQSTLHALGVYHFDQIAAWTPANVAWVDQYLRLRGRIGEEQWVEQAQARARGEGAGVRLYRAPEDA